MDGDDENENEYMSWAENETDNEHVQEFNSDQLLGKHHSDEMVPLFESGRNQLLFIKLEVKNQAKNGTNSARAMATTLLKGIFQERALRESTLSGTSPVPNFKPLQLYPPAAEAVFEYVTDQSIEKDWYPDSIKEDRRIRRLFREHVRNGISSYLSSLRS